MKKLLSLLLILCSFAAADTHTRGVVTGGTFSADTFFKSGRPWYDVMAFGAVCDGQTVSDANITATLNALTTTTTKFTAADVGKRIVVNGAGAASAPLVTTIASFVSSSSITTTANAATTVTNGIITWGTDDNVALQAAFTAAANGTVFVPKGTCMSTVALSLPPTTNLDISGGASIQAAALISADGLVKTSTSSAAQNPEIYGGGTIDANSLADIGLWLSRFNNAHVHDIIIRSALVNGIRLGSTPLGVSSYGARVERNWIFRPSSSAVPASSIGIWFDNAADSVASSNEITGYQKGMLVDTSQNVLIRNHAWAFTPTDMTIAFEDTAVGNEWDDDYADSPGTYGFHLSSTSNNTRIIGGKVYNNSSASDNVMVGIQIDQAAPFETIEGVHFFGSDASHRIATDIVCAAGFGNILGGLHQNANVVTKNSTTFRATNMATPKIVTYNSINTIGIGVPALYGTAISQTGQTATQTAATLCTTTNCPAGHYRVSGYVDSTVSCGTPGPAIVALSINYTDEISAKVLSPTLQGSGVATNTITLGNLTAFGEFVGDFWTAGAANVTFTATYTACTTGTGTYALRLITERLQ